MAAVAACRRKTNVLEDCYGKCAHENGKVYSEENKNAAFWEYAWIL
jgi:hypothetical protein